MTFLFLKKAQILTANFLGPFTKRPSSVCVVFSKKDIDAPPMIYTKNPYFKMEAPATQTGAWQQNPLCVSALTRKINDETTVKLTQARIGAYVKSKHPHLPDDAIGRIIAAEICDIKMMILEGGINSKSLKFKEREPFIDRLITIEITKIFG